MDNDLPNSQNHLKKDICTIDHTTQTPTEINQDVKSHFFLIEAIIITINPMMLNKPQRAASQRQFFLVVTFIALALSAIVLYLVFSMRLFTQRFNAIAALWSVQRTRRMVILIMRLEPLYVAWLRPNLARLEARR